MIFAALSLLLVTVNAGLILRNQSAEAEVQQRQQFINQSAQLGQVSAVLIQLLGAAALNGKDDALRALLSDVGITINGPNAGTSSPTPNAGPDARKPQ